jgi:RNA polymerase sigma-70 factor (ECF subfamily)
VYTEASAAQIARARVDRAAFGEIYDLYLRRVYAFCLAKTGDTHVAEDMTSQTFERALNAIGRYEDRGAPLSSWLFRIAGNVLIDRGRRAGRETPIGEESIPEERIQAGGEDDPEQEVERWERAERIRAAVDTLPADQKRAVQLRYFDGLSVAETAQRVGRNENATKQLLFRAMTSLRARLGERDV